MEMFRRGGICLLGYILFDFSIDLLGKYSDGGICLLGYQF